MFKRSLIILLFLSSFGLHSQQSTFEKQRSNFDFNKISKELLNIEKNNNSNNLDEDSLLQMGSNLWTNTKNDFKNIHGRIDLNYSYGLNTVFTDTTRGIASIIGSSGNIQSGVLGLPIMISYNYSTLKVPLGANNYFRISFDKQKYLDNQKAKLDKQISSVLDVEEKLKNNKARISNVQGQTEVYLDMLKRSLEKEARLMAQEQKEIIKDSISDNIESTTNSSQERSDSVQQKRDDAQRNIDNYKKEYDSIMTIYHKILSVQKSCDSLINKYERYNEKLTGYKERLKDPSLPLNGEHSFDKLDFVNSIQKVDIGLTYPKTTALSDQNTAIKGIGTEFQYKNYYLALSAGLTMNNVMLSTNEINNQLNYNQNVFNQFDFQKVKDNGVLTSVKTGWGTPETTHALIGFNYLTNTRFFGVSNTIDSPYDPAASVELDLRYVPLIYSGGILDVVYGKTSANNDLDSLINSDVFGSLFSNYQSNILMIKYAQYVSKIRSDFSVQYRSIDPKANTTVYGMMQPGNRRIAFESRHKILPYLKFGTTYKIDESYGTERFLNLQSTGINVSGNYKEFLTYSTMVNYVMYSAENESGDIIKGTSYLTGINLQSDYKVQKLKALIGFNFNDYLISDTSKSVKYTQFGIIKAIGGRNWSSSLNYDYFFQTDKGFETGTNVFGIGGEYIMEDLKFDGGISISTNDNSNTSLGGYLEMRWIITKFFDLTVRGERFVMGDFYRSYYRTLYERLPYLFTINAGFKF